MIFGITGQDGSYLSEFLIKKGYLVHGVAKLYAHWITINYREAYNLFACNGILFNHESPVRGETFVTKKIVNGLCKIKSGYQKKLKLFC